MTSKLKQISLNTAAIAALMTAYPAATFAQSLDVTCSGGGVGGDFCQDADMTEVETVVNGNDAYIANPTSMAAALDGVTAQEATYSDLTSADVYDGIWCNFSMLHTPLTAWPDQFAAIARALKPGGLMHFGTKLGVGEKRDGIGRLYSYMTESALTALLGQTGFTVEYLRTGEEKGLDGKLASFIVIQARTLA